MDRLKCLSGENPPCQHEKGLTKLPILKLIDLIQPNLFNLFQEERSPCLFPPRSKNWLQALLTANTVKKHGDLLPIPQADEGILLVISWSLLPWTSLSSNPALLVPAGWSAHSWRQSGLLL